MLLLKASLVLQEESLIMLVEVLCVGLWDGGQGAPWYQQVQDGGLFQEIYSGRSNFHSENQEFLWSQ